MFTFTRYLINLVFSFIEIILLLRFILRLFGANYLAPFVAWIYETSNSLIRFFWGAFPNPKLSNDSVFEINTLFTLLVYTVIYLAVNQLLVFFEGASSQKTSH